jgi:hypothetical protein
VEKHSKKNEKETKMKESWNNKKKEESYQIEN